MDLENFLAVVDKSCLVRSHNDFTKCSSGNAFVRLQVINLTISGCIFAPKWVEHPILQISNSWLKHKFWQTQILADSNFGRLKTVDCDFSSTSIKKMRRSDDYYGVAIENLCDESIFFDALTGLESQDVGRKRGLYAPIDVDVVSINSYSSSDSRKVRFVENIVTEVWENHRLVDDRKTARRSVKRIATKIRKFKTYVNNSRKKHHQTSMYYWVENLPKCSPCRKWWGSIVIVHTR